MSLKAVFSIAEVTGAHRPKQHYDSSGSRLKTLRLASLYVNNLELWHYLLLAMSDTGFASKERSDLFLNEYLPKLCQAWDADRGCDIYSTILDARAFMARLTRLLLSGIRKIPEHKTKAESSQGIYICATSGYMWTQRYIS